jgi:predicted phage terminase large subunit-like protein
VAEGDVPIRADWVRFWTAPAGYDTVVLSVDPAVTAKESADASAVVVLGLVGQNPSPSPPREGGWGVRSAVQVHVLAATARRVTAPDLVALIAAADRRWQPDVILFESNAAFAGIRDLLARHAAFGPKVKGVTQTKDKAARAAALAVPVENGSVLLQGDGRGNVDETQRELFDQMTTFPFAAHDDLLDALGTGVAHLLNRPEPRAWVV